MHFAGGPDDLGQVHGGEARTGAEIDDLAAVADLGARPGFKRARPPDTVLEAQAVDFIVMGAEDLIAFSHKAAPY
jgi:hypothetical protein